MIGSLRHLIIALLFTSNICLLSKDLDVFYFKTPHLKTIYYCGDYCGDDSRGPAVIKVGDEVIFQTMKDERGDYESFSLAGSPYSHQPTQLKGKGVNTVCLRWVIQVGFPRRDYIIDFTDPKPIVVGPFRALDRSNDSDEVQTVYWGKYYALIKFKSLHRFKYYYKEKTVVED